MKLEYSVHKVSYHKVSAPVTHMGEETMAEVPMTEVELVPVEEPRNGTIALRFYSSTDRDNARNLFKQDAKVTLSFEGSGVPEQAYEGNEEPKVEA